MLQDYNPAQEDLLNLKTSPIPLYNRGCSIHYDGCLMGDLNFCLELERPCSLEGEAGGVSDSSITSTSNLSRERDVAQR